MTGTVVGVAVGASGGGDTVSDVAARPAPSPVQVKGESEFLADRVNEFSRSAKRTTVKELPEVRDHEFMNAPLNVWPTPKESGDPLTVLDWGSKVAVTGKVTNGFAQIVVDGQVRWVNADYLQEKKPKPKPKPEKKESAPAAGGLSDAPCAAGSDIESGITPGAVRVYRAVCAAFPQVEEYGGYRGDGEHADGHAIDIMVYEDSATGDAIADFLLANAEELGVEDIIWSQQIWTDERSSEGWRAMEDRGSVTANHYDHVHVRAY